MYLQPTRSGRTTSSIKNAYLNDRLSAQRILSCMSLTIPLGLFVLYLITPHTSDVGSELILINISSVVIIVAAFLFLLNWKKPRNDKYQLSCVLFDFLAAAAILIGYALSYNVPISIALKSPTANIFFIYLTSRIVLFDGRIVVQTGFMAIGTWAVLVGLAMLEPQYAGRTTSYIEYLTSFKILFGAEMERMFQFGIITAILYTYIHFARHDRATGFLRRSYFLNSVLKFLSQPKSKFLDKTYALLEFRAVNISDSSNTYPCLFKNILETETFQSYNLKKIGRLSHQSVAAWIEYSGSEKDLLKAVQNIHQELSDKTIAILGTETPPFVIGGTILNPTASYHSQLTHLDLAIQEAIKDSEKALIFDDALETKLMFKQNVEQVIKQGLEANLISVVYQPIIDLMTDKPIGFETLVRLTTKIGEKIPPDVFIPIAERSGLIDDITDYLCDCISREAGEIQDMFIGSKIDPYININISPIQLKDINRIISALKRAHDSGIKINVEITESSILNEHNTDAQIQALKDEGFSVAIDDFGTGYSSIQRLNKLDSMALKIDQSFVRNIEDRKAYSFLNAIVNLAHTTSNLVIVEGVETLQEKLLLMKMGVRYCQGYFYGKPMDVYDLENYLAQKYDITRPKQRRSGHIASF